MDVGKEVPNHYKPEFEFSNFISFLYLFYAYIIVWKKILKNPIHPPFWVFSLIIHSLCFIIFLLKWYGFIISHHMFCLFSFQLYTFLNEGGCVWVFQVLGEQASTLASCPQCVGEGYCSCEPDEYGSLCHPHHKLSELWGQEQPQIWTSYRAEENLWRA